MPRVFRFGPFELDAATGDLRKDHRPLRLPPQPAKVLALLVSGAGEVVTQEQIRREIWGENTFVDFEAGLHYCLTRIRGVLNDDAGAPRYIETLPRRGYRFVAAVTEDRDVGAIAVLPFANLNQDTAFDYFADGVADMLITELGRLGAMRVISRQSTLQFRGCETPLPQIARMLGVDVVVEGTVLREGSRVRVTVQLLQAEPERHLWAQSYEGEAVDILMLQRKLASSIVAEVDRTLRGDVPRVSARPKPEAYEAYLKGRFYAADWTSEALTRAVHEFRRARDLDPTFAPAHAGLANCHALLGYWNHVPPSEAYSLAKASAVQALALDDGSSEGHAALSWVLLWQDWDVAACERELARAIALNPSNETARMQHALDAICLRQDRDLALSEMAEAVRLDPLSVLTGSAAAWVLFFVRDYDRAGAQARATLEMHPLALQAWYVLGLANCLQGRASEAIGALERAVEISPVPLSFAYLGRALAAAGQQESARAILDRLLGLPPGELLSLKPLVILHGALGDLDNGFECLGRAFKARDTFLFSLRAAAVYDPLRADPRFDRFLAQVDDTLGIAATA